MNCCTLAPNSTKSIIDNPFPWFTPHYKNQISWLSKVNWLQQAEGTRSPAYKAITPFYGCNFKCDGRISYKYKGLRERKMKNQSLSPNLTPNHQDGLSLAPHSKAITQMKKLSAEEMCRILALVPTLLQPHYCWRFGIVPLLILKLLTISLNEFCSQTQPMSPIYVWDEKVITKKIITWYHLKGLCKN